MPLKEQWSTWNSEHVELVRLHLEKGTADDRDEWRKAANLSTVEREEDGFVF